MSILPTWPIAAGTLVLGLSVGACIDHTVMSGRIAKIEKAHADVLEQIAQVQDSDQRAARSKERDMGRLVGKAEQEKEDAQNQARAAATAALNSERMRQRSERRTASGGGVPEAPAACAGTTGAELSRPDAAFLVGFAQRADEQRAALAACYSAYDALK